MFEKERTDGSNAVSPMTSTSFLGVEWLERLPDRKACEVGLFIYPIDKLMPTYDNWPVG